MSYSSEVLADSPAAYYRMSESSAMPQDSSGNANHMTVEGGTPTYSQAGALPSDPSNNAIRLDIAGLEFFTAPDHATLDYGDVFTLEAWIKRLSTSGAPEEGIITKGTDAGGLYLQNDKLMLAKQSVAVIVISTTTITDTTTWHHVVGTKNGATINLYIDGVDRTGTPTDSTCLSTANPLETGGEGGTGSPIDCIVDEVAVYPTALSAARVLAHYNAALESSPTWTSLPRRGMASVS